ncbi:glycosyltransferase family 2 protein [Sarcina sp. JB2]|uniref:Glycosyltransferase family 2 protein n=1 Tax=Candidatus Sarcina troglodytae TaxID=2726954 RepID=A0ACD1BBC8_9CLOT|nr:glycosyltransferase family 2 protein [Sarcina sp. JB2]QPJ84751.1 glycosyltransferase family 2 protein [Sarcina sp. JB2]
MNKLVSIIIPTYNREKLIQRSIDSVLNQTYKNIEIIIVDDNSTDNTYKVIKSYMEKYSFIKYIKHSVNKGACVARNTGIKVAKGYYIAFLDSDDEWTENKLEKSTLIFEKEKSIGIVYSNMYLIDCKTGKSKIHKSKKYRDNYYGLLCENIIGSTSLIIVKKEIFDDVGMFKEGLVSCQDWDFYINVAQKHKIAKIDEPLLKYYIHSESISGNMERVLEGHKYIIDKVNNILSQDIKYRKYKNKIVCYQNLNIARIYRRFNQFNQAKEFYSKAFINNPMNKEAYKNFFAMKVGEKIYNNLR